MSESRRTGGPPDADSSRGGDPPEGSTLSQKLRSSGDARGHDREDLAPEYELDYTTAKPNRFANRIHPLPEHLGTDPGPSSLSVREHAECIDRCHRLARLLIEGRNTFEEYAYNITLTAVQASVGGIQDCVETIPPHFLTALAAYLRATLKPVDFMPSPDLFLAGPVPKEIANRRKRELRSGYLRFYELVAGAARASHQT